MGSAQRRRMATCALAGVALAFVATLVYLLATGSLAAYRQVLDFKHSVFPFPGTVSVLSSIFQLVSSNGTGLVLGLSGALLVVVLALAAAGTIAEAAPTAVPRLTEGRTSWTCEPALVTLVMWLLLAAGYAWQGKPPAEHYVVTLQLPTVLAVVAVFRIMAVHRPPRLSPLVVWFLALICLVPQPSLVRSYRDTAPSPTRLIGALRGLERPQDVAMYARPGQLSPSDRCIQVAYGWAAANVYHYSHRPSCSRFFLAALVVKPWQVAEMRHDIATAAPAVVVYWTVGADVVVSGFETTVIPWKAVLTACYASYGGGIYTAKSPVRGVVAACIGTAMRASGLPAP